MKNQTKLRINIQYSAYFLHTENAMSNHRNFNELSTQYFHAIAPYIENKAK